MPMCSIRQCGSQKNKKWPDLTFHRFPANEKLKKKWIEAIGVENISLHHKVRWVCSKHFEERNFNRTLDVVRLRDNSVPSLFMASNSPNTSVLIENENVQEFEFVKTLSQSQNIAQDVAKGVGEDCTEASNSPNTSDIENENVQEFEFVTTLSQSQNITEDVAEGVGEDCTEISNSTTTYNSTDMLIEKELKQRLQLFARTSTQSQNITQNVACAEMQQNVNKIKKLTKTCMMQRKQIKRLNERVRKRNKKIALLNNIIEHLTDTNKIEYAFIVAKSK